jgi:hypothetical protein
LVNACPGASTVLSGIVTSVTNTELFTHVSGGAGVTVTTWTEGIGVAVTTRGVWVAGMTGATEMAMDAGALETSDVFTARTVIV